MDYFAEPGDVGAETVVVVCAAQTHLAAAYHGHAFTVRTRAPTRRRGILPALSTGEGWRTAMYVSRLSFYTRPGQTDAVAKRLEQLADLVVASGLPRPRVLRMSMASPGAPDVQFEEEFAQLADLERSMQEVVAAERFREWSTATSELLLQPPKREILTIT